MLTFYYNDYRVYIHDDGSVEYVHLDYVPTKPVVVTDPPAAVMAIATAILPLVSSDVATERVAQFRRKVQIATTVAYDTKYTECEAHRDHNSAKSELSTQLKTAEEVLQLA